MAPALVHTHLPAFLSFNLSVISIIAIPYFSRRNVTIRSLPSIFFLDGQSAKWVVIAGTVRLHDRDTTLASRLPVIPSPPVARRGSDCVFIHVAVNFSGVWSRISMCTASHTGVVSSDEAAVLETFVQYRPVESDGSFGTCSSIIPDFFSPTCVDGEKLFHIERVVSGIHAKMLHIVDFCESVVGLLEVVVALFEGLFGPILNRDISGHSVEGTIVDPAVHLQKVTFEFFG